MSKTMKAILKYGQFTSMIELPRLLPTIHIMKPHEAPSYLPLEELPDVRENKSIMLKFLFRKRLSDDIYLYEFESES